MPSATYRTLPGGPARRAHPAGVLGGSPLTRVDGPGDALNLVGDALRASETALRELVRSDVAAVPVVAGYLVDAGGKRLRPALTALGALALGRPANPRLMCVGELIHLGSLLHDDVVDDAVTRRGRPATHTVFGPAVTVLTGDFCLARAVLLAAEEGGHEAVTALASAVTEMAEGEVLQLQRSGDLSCTLDRYLDMVEKKSAALIAWCTAASAYEGGNAEAAGALSRFGRNVGIAFQVTDDVLDYRSGTGKAPGADLRERKVTLPLLYAMEANPGLRAELQAAAPSPEQLPLLMKRIEQTGALEQALAYARRRVDEGIEGLSALPAGVGREALAVLGRYLVDRAV